MFDLNSFVGKDVAKRARELGLIINVFYHKAACSPRTWNNCSTLVTLMNVTNDLYSKDEVFPFVVNDRNGCQLQHKDIIEQYTSRNGLEIDNYIWIPVYLSTKDMLPFYSSNKTPGSNIIGFLLKDLVGTSYKPPHIKDNDTHELKAKMAKELVLLNRWQRGGLISISLRNQQGREVKRIDNITDKSCINSYLTQVIPQFEDHYA